MQPRSVSLIVTTYNWAPALELVLLSIKQQSILPDEVIIADDGSGEDTRALITQYQQTFPVPLIHSWQEDEGFRAARSRNLAISKTSGDYVVMIDGDMLLHKHFIRDHKRFAKQNYFVQGSRVILTKPLTEQLFKTKSISFSPFSSQVKNKLNAICCPFLSKMLSHRLTKKGVRSVRSCNFAVWKKDIIKVNGFNEDFIGWGREDSEFVVRLINSGVLRQDLRFGGVTYHLFHNENSRNNLPKNDQMLQFAIDNKTVYCDNGLNNHQNS
ncbi:glycosyltransferase family 2 protein [Orbaceae bacterium ac157xtp]